MALDQLSQDKTRKFLFSFRDNEAVETVYIPDPVEDRGAVCISSQVGCTLSCRFCHTGTQRLARNLSAAEIVGQFMAARDAYREWPSPKGETPRLLSTIVLMGMGEPLYNYENVAKAMKIVMDGEGIGLSRRRITLSTSGVVPMMDQAGAELGVNLAVSLHAVTDDLRDELVPLNRKYPIAELLAACRRYPGASNARRITFEYVMLKNINDSEAEARELVRLLAGLPAKVNLIPFNPWPGSAYASSSPFAIRRFANIVMDAGYAAPVRTPRGQDILAACGQLKSSIGDGLRASGGWGREAPDPSNLGLGLATRGAKHEILCFSSDQPKIPGNEPRVGHSKNLYKKFSCASRPAVRAANPLTQANGVWGLPAPAGPGQRPGLTATSAPPD